MYKDKKAGFGAIMLDYDKISVANILQDTPKNKYGRINGVVYTITVDIPKYVPNGILYDIKHNIFAGIESLKYFCHSYLFKQHIKYKQQNNIDLNTPMEFELFMISPTAESLNVSCINSPLDVHPRYLPFIQQVALYLNNMNNAMTALQLGYKLQFTDSSIGHNLLVILHRYNDIVTLFLIDSNDNSSRALIRETNQKLSTKVQVLIDTVLSDLKEPKTFTWDLHMLDTIKVNTSGKNIFSQKGYCLLVSSFLLNIIHDNFVILGNISVNTNPNTIRLYLTQITKYFHDYLLTVQITDEANAMLMLLSNYSYKVLHLITFPDPDKPLNQRYINQVSVRELRKNPNYNDGDENINFKDLFMTYLTEHNIYQKCVGIAFSSTPINVFEEIQSKNKFYYYIPERVKRGHSETMNFMAVHGQHTLIIHTDWTRVTMVNTTTQEERILNVSFDNMYLVFIKLRNIAVDDYNSILPFITKMRYTNSNKRKYEETEEKVDKVDNEDDGYATEEIEY